MCFWLLALLREDRRQTQRKKGEMENMGSARTQGVATIQGALFLGGSKNVVKAGWRVTERPSFPTIEFQLP